MKTCGKCKEGRELGEFAPNRNQKDGLHNWCRPCSRAYRREYEKTHPRPYSKRKIEYTDGDHLHIKARRVVNHQVAKGEIPRIGTRNCVDCGAQAQQYDHYKGYLPENWLDIEPVCFPCSNKRDIARGNRRRYA